MHVCGVPGHVIRHAQRVLSLTPGDAAVRMRQEIVHRGCQAMRDGLTPTDAARAVHVSRATRSRWEQSPERLSRHTNRC
ncbi:MAG: hypothetical protein OXD33_01120 [Rhodobacteraceae bacterium]|nr:hypothetical protein [Paracoccaceae bacterium]